MKVLFVSSGTQNGLPSPIIKAQGDSLKEQGINVTFFCIQKKGIKGYLSEVSRLKKHLKKNQVDIIHAHYALCGWVAWLSRPKAPIILSFMGDDLLGSRKSSGNISFLSKIVASINRFLGNYLLDSSIVKSDQMLSKLRSKKSITIPNGVNINTFQPLEKNKARELLNLRQESKIIIFVSNPERPEKNYELLMSSVEISPLEAEVIPVFNVPHQTIQLYMNAADVLALPSYHEGSPNVIKEAMACNCPIVSTPCGDVPQIINDVEGCYLSKYSPKEFSSHLLKAFDFSISKGRTKGRDKLLSLQLDSASIAKKIISNYSKLID